MSAWLFGHRVRDFHEWFVFCVLFVLICAVTIKESSPSTSVGVGVGVGVAVAVVALLVVFFVARRLRRGRAVSIMGGENDMVQMHSVQSSSIELSILLIL